MYYNDVIIIGSGGSGLSLAIKLKQAGVSNVAIISKVSVMGSHTTAAKGGINAALSSISEDKTEWHTYDTLKSSNTMGDVNAIEEMCVRAPSEIDFLVKQGVKFDRLENGKIAQRRYGGQKTHFGKGDFAFRSCFVADNTGFEIMRALHSSAINLSIDIFEFHFVFEVSTNKIFALDLKTGKFVCFNFKMLVFAGGGFSQNFFTNSSANSLTGDCHVLAMQLGAEMEDMEFVQFHPTGLYGKGILISEAVRAEGGVLLNAKGERFMEKYSPNFLELASRDIVTKAIFEEGQGLKPAFLRLKHLDKEVIKTKLKGTLQTAKFFAGIDVFSEDIPVFPTAHYNMGGIKVNKNYQVKENIFAIGECANARIHGANRLGCNSLLELFTSSSIVCQNILNNLSNYNFDVITSTPNFLFLDNQNKITFEELLKIKYSLAKTMEKYCGVVREEKGLEYAFNLISKMLVDLKQKSPQINSLIFNNTFVLFFEVSNLITLSLEVLKGAIKRKESRGSHLRADFPEIDDNFNRY